MGDDKKQQNDEPLTVGEAAHEAEMHYGVIKNKEIKGGSESRGSREIMDQAIKGA